MFGEEGQGFAQGLDAVDPGHQWRLAAFGQGAGGSLVAKQFQCARIRTDKDDAGGLSTAGEVGVLGEKAVVGMNGVAVLGANQLDQLVHVQVGLHSAPAQRYGQVALARVQAGAVVCGEYRHRADVQVGAGAGDADAIRMALRARSWDFTPLFCYVAGRWLGTGDSAPGAVDARAKCVAIIVSL